MLAKCLALALWQLRSAGYAGDVGWAFWGNKEAALTACRRAHPRSADEAADLAAKGKAETKEIVDLWHWEAPRGPKRGVLVEGREFTLAPDGRVLCDGVPTRYRINQEYRCWVLLDPNVNPNHEPPRRHYAGRGGKATALKDAAVRLSAEFRGATKRPGI